MNGECHDDTPLGLLMQDFFCTNPDDMHYAPLRERARYFKENEKGVLSMSSVVDEIKQEEREKAAERLLKMGKLSLEEVARAANLTLEAVTRLAKQQPA